MRYQELKFTKGEGCTKRLRRLIHLHWAWHSNSPAVRQYKVGDHVQVKLSGGRIVQATIKAIIDTTDGIRLQVSFGEETALIYPWRIVIEAR